MRGRPTLDTLTHYGTDFDADFDYTPQEKAAIIDALPVRLDASGVELLFWMLGGIDVSVKGSSAEIPAQEKLVTASRDGLAACEVHIAAVRTRQADPEALKSFTASPVDELALAPLEAARDAFQIDLEMNERVLAYLRSRAPTGQARPVADNIMERCALTWEHHGLEVSANSSFRAFFDAVVGPKFRNRRVATELKSAWSGNKLAGFVAKRRGPKRDRKQRLVD